MAITKVSQFLTSDQTIFATAKDAAAHENCLELVALVGAEALATLEAKYDLKTKRAPRKTPEEKAAEAAVKKERKAAAEAAKAEAKAEAKAAVEASKASKPAKAGK